MRGEILSQRRRHCGRETTLLTTALAILLPATLWAQSDSAWTMSRCVAEALHQSPRRVIVAEQVAAAQASHREARANRWPTLGWGATYAYASETQQIELSPIPIPGYVPTPIKFGDGNVYDVQLAARVPLFAGGALEEKERADRAAYHAAMHDVAADSALLVYDVRRTYLNALSAQARYDTQQQSVKRLTRHLDDLEKAMAIGAASHESLITARARLRQAEAQVALAEGQLKAARLTLGRLVGVPNDEITPAGELETSFLDPSATGMTALESRADVRAVALRIEQSRHLSRLVGGAYLPTLSGTAAYHYAKPGVNAVKNEWMDYYTLGLSASWTLWDWRAREAKVTQARAAERSLEARQQELLDALRSRRQTAVTTLAAAREAQAMTAERVKLERQRLALVEGRYRIGMATETDFLDAQDDLAGAETEWISATVNVRLVEAELGYLAGR